MNALIKAPYDKGPLVMFSTTSPCQTCAMLIRQSRIEAIYYTTPYRLLEGVTLLQDRGLIVQHVPNKEA
jgi:deoxycytidylate deaminase